MRARFAPGSWTWLLAMAYEDVLRNRAPPDGAVEGRPGGSGLKIQA